MLSSHGFWSTNLHAMHASARNYDSKLNPNAQDQVAKNTSRARTGPRAIWNEDFGSVFRMMVWCTYVYFCILFTIAMRTVVAVDGSIELDAHNTLYFYFLFI